jgi:hypothetical protein
MSNKQQLQGVYSRYAVERGFGLYRWRTPDGEVVDVTAVMEEAGDPRYQWPDMILVGDVADYVETIQERSKTPGGLCALDATGLLKARRRDDPAAVEEVSEVLSRCARGQIECKHQIRESWWNCSEATIAISGWEIDVFVEAGWIYEILGARRPTGEEIKFENTSVDQFLRDEDVDLLCFRLGRDAGV